MAAPRRQACRAAGVEYRGMDIRFLTIYPESGPCPQCGRPATFRLIDFDSPTIGVGCSVECGHFTMSKPNTVHLRTFLWYPVLDRRTADGTHSGRTAEGCSNHRPHQFVRPDQNISAG